MSLSVVQLTDPHVSVYTTVPKASEPDSCKICHVPRDPDFPRCWSCSQTAGGVSRPLTLVVPISLYQSNSQLGHWLRRYKDPDGRVTEVQQRRFRMLIAATFGRFLASHESCIIEAAGRSWDIVTTVPSTIRPPPHPFEQALRLLPGLAPKVQTMLRPGSGTIGRNSPSDTGYETVREMDGIRVLLVDDTWTTGSHLQSAASALSLAGADVLAAVVVGRVIRTDWSFTDDTWWSEMRQKPFTFDSCSLE